MRNPKIFVFGAALLISALFSACLSRSAATVLPNEPTDAAFSDRPGAASVRKSPFSRRFSSPVAWVDSAETLPHGLPAVEPGNRKRLWVPFWVESNKSEQAPMDALAYQVFKDKFSQADSDRYETVDPKIVQRLLHSDRLRRPPFPAVQVVSGMLGADFYIEFLAENELFSDRGAVTWKAQAVEPYSGRFLYFSEQKSRFPSPSDNRSAMLSEFSAFYDQVAAKTAEIYDEIRRAGEYFQIRIEDIPFMDSVKIEKELSDLFRVVTRKEINKDRLLIGGVGQKDAARIETAVFDAVNALGQKERLLQLQYQDAFSFFYRWEKLGFHEK